MAAPVENGNFSFSVDSFYVKTSNNNLHRRATLPELQALFQPAGTNIDNNVDRVGHWYEAQLLHYGLPPSKNKAVAKTRLLDAYRTGNLAVPKNILKIEADLKRAWKKRDKESRSLPQTSKSKAGTTRMAATKPTVNTNNKREREDDIYADRDDTKDSKKKTTTKIAGKKAVSNSTTGPTPKPKATKKTPELEKVETKNTKMDDTTPVRKKQTAKRGGAVIGSKKTQNKVSALSDATTEKNPRTKQTARRAAAFVGSKKPQAKVPATAGSGVEEKPGRKQTAPRGGRLSKASAMHRAAETSTSGPVYYSGPSSSPKQAIKRGGRLYSPSGRQIQTARRPFSSSFQASNDENNVEDDEDSYEAQESYESQISYGETEQQYYDRMNTGGARDSSEDSSGSSASLRPLGLINGVYEISSDDLDQWSEYSQDDFELILSLAGDAVWGAYDFGMHSGILHMPERPYSASYRKVPFTWRGRENGEGQMSYQDECQHGWIQFLGDGRIEGQIDVYGQGKFTGKRISGQETRPPRDVRSMRDEWNSYNEDAYERERVGRWH